MKLAAPLALFAVLLSCTPDGHVQQAQGKLAEPAHDAQQAEIDRAQAEFETLAQRARMRATEEKATRPRFAFAQRQVFRDAMRADLVTLDAQIGELDAKAERAHGAAKGAIIVSADELRARRQKLQAELDRIAHVTHANWDAFQDGVDDDFVDLRGDLRFAFAEIERRP